MPSTSIYLSNVASKAQGYMMMPQVEVPGGASSLKRAMPPTKSCRATSTLVGNAFQAAGQAGAALHIMAVKI